MFKNIILKHYEQLLNVITVISLILVAVLIIFNKAGAVGFFIAIGSLVVITLLLGLMYTFIDVRSILIDIKNNTINDKISKTSKDPSDNIK
ncbi:MAG: hypothetical protein LBF22_02775 [Deltaproteobacteria bacterium]|jgi:hypothetical protein|nr:hypothetical protein [Deltaproteobacteria bacterium]